MPAEERARAYPELLTFARNRLRRLGLAPPLDADALRAALEIERRTTISLIATTELPPYSAFGVTGSQGEHDVVLYEARTTRSHQTLIVLHEYAHMLLQHPPSEVLHTQAGPATFHEIDPQMIAEVLGLQAPSTPEPPPAPPSRPGRRWWPAALRRDRLSRGCNAATASPGANLYARVAEREAETLATILLGWVPGQARYIPARPPGLLDDILGDEGAW